MNEHYHCWWCGHVIEMECGYSVVASTSEPDRHLCHGDDHDCYAAAYEARKAKAQEQNVRQLIEFQI